jgi:hypothetical protein
MTSDKSTPSAEPVQGRRSNLKCTCGGALIQTRPQNMFRLLSGGYTCENCHRPYSTTSALAHNLIQVEPMPQGANVIYYSSELESQPADGPEDEPEQSK